jgi:Protein of unknown function (DUF933)
MPALNLFFALLAYSLSICQYAYGYPRFSSLSLLYRFSLSFAIADFQKNFIMAEIFSYDDLKEAGSEAGVRAAGKLRMEGKKYEIQDGDICFFKVGK